jgi:hypothetical protein
MIASDFHSKPIVPDTVKHLDADVVVEVLSRHGVNVTERPMSLASGRRICVVCCGLVRS